MTPYQLKCLERLARRIVDGEDQDAIRDILAERAALLAACETAAAWWDAGPTVWTEPSPIVAIRAAIRKAKGGAS